MRHRELLKSIEIVKDRLNDVVDGHNEIGNLCIAVSVLAEAVEAMIKTDAATKARQADHEDYLDTRRRQTPAEFYSE